MSVVWVRAQGCTSGTRALFRILLKLGILRNMVMSTVRKVPCMLAFGVLVAVAIGAGCHGFFQDPTLNSVAIQPPSPQVEVGTTTTVNLQAWGVYSDNSRSRITSGVAWTSSDTTIAKIIGPCANATPCGDATLEGVGNGTVTITVAAQGISTTAQAQAYLGNISGLTVCTGAFDTGNCPAPTVTIPSTGGTQDYYAKATSNGTTVDVTTGATFVVAPTPAVGSITCDSSTSPAVCTVLSGTSTGTNYVLTVTYPGVAAVTADITVN